MFRKLLLLFILVPLIELGIFLALSEYISLILTLLIIVATGALGAYLAKREGAHALTSFKQALGKGDIPTQQAVDGILILIAGAVLLTPGFLTDALGFALLIPTLRKLVKPPLLHWVQNHLSFQAASAFPRSSGASTSHAHPHAQPELKPARGRVIDTK